MSETKPPEGYEDWLEWVVFQAGSPLSGIPNVEHARAELAQLREQAAAYQNVMHELCRLPELNMSNYDSDQVAKLNTGVNNLVIAEIAANRFTP